MAFGANRAASTWESIRNSQSTLAQAATDTRAEEESEQARRVVAYSDVWQGRAAKPRSTHAALTVTSQDTHSV